MTVKHKRKKINQWRLFDWIGTLEKIKSALFVIGNESAAEFLDELLHFLYDIYYDIDSNIIVELERE